MSRLHSDLYFGVQRMRHGVSPDMVAQATKVLDLPADLIRDRALDRLRAIHGRAFSWSDLAARPVIERSSLIPAAARALQERRRNARVDVRRTSGSTGTPFVFPKDRLMTAWMDAAMWAVYGWHGVRPGAPHVRFWGMPLHFLKRTRMRLSDLLLNRTRISAFELSRKRAADQFRAIRRRRPVYAYGYPTLMKAFADHCVDAGLDGRDLGIEVVISTGEILTPAVRAGLAAFFGCGVVNEYGCTESGIVAFECGSGTLHTVPVAVWPEVVDSAGVPVVPGSEGEVVISDLFGSVVPLLRYRLHDRAAPSSAACECGRQLPSMRVASGRSDSFIQTPAGRVYDAILAYSVPAGVLRFKAVQVAPDRIDARIVPRPGADPSATAAECRETWERLLGGGLTIRVHAVDEIPLEPSGKLRYFVPLEHAADDAP